MADHPSHQQQQPKLVEPKCEREPVRPGSLSAAAAGSSTAAATGTTMAAPPTTTMKTAPTTTTGDGDQNGTDSMADSMKLMADKHATIRSHLNQAQLELMTKLETIKALEEKLRVGCSQIRIAEQKLNSLNETFYRNNETLQGLERLHGELVLESVDLDEKILQATQMMEAVTVKEQADKKVVEEYKQKVMEVDSKDPSRQEQEQKLKFYEEEYAKLCELEERAKANDPELEKIISGQAGQIVDAQKLAIMEAYSEQQGELEQLQQQLDEKRQEVKSLEQSIKVEEKQNQARLLRMQKQLHELQETERHLKKTALHLESQRDFGME